MKFILLLAFLAFVHAEELTPEFLDELLEQKRYEEYSEYMEIDNPEHVNPDIVRENPMFHEDMYEGDIMLKPWQKEQQRQGLRFDKYTGSRWPNQQGRPSYIPIVISNQFSENDRNTIINGLVDFNNKLRDCIEFVWRNGQNDYINIMKGDGCWSYLGRTGGGQSLSLGNGCVYNSVVVHELDHAVGFSHEQNRHDRDDFVEVLWDNIPENWRSQYQKNDPNDYGLQSNYDYYSIMHYGMKAPGTNKDAFRIKQNGIDTNRIGNGNSLTATDVEKIKILYGCRR